MPLTPCPSCGLRIDMESLHQCPKCGEPVGPELSSAYRPSVAQQTSGEHTFYKVFLVAAFICLALMAFCTTENWIYGYKTRKNLDRVVQSEEWRELEQSLKDAPELQRELLRYLKNRP